ncbi:amino acid adenylation domain-containing protein [Timonella sp. A28]|uniref:amino acid adenylation domain-containing protein n=1 Tax=Timonella sp. A28 TaxID=3442640 RepID=UPI003EB884A2
MIEDILPLAPLQEGLLFHAVEDTSALDVYTMQSTYRFPQGADEHALFAACESLLTRHSILRAGFSHEKFAAPVQFIPRAVNVPWRTERIEHAGRELDAIQREERQKRFDLDRPPLIRFVFVRAEDESAYLIVTNHHILIDGWSDALLVVELLRHYCAGGRDDTLPQPAQFRDYLAWLKNHDESAAQTLWKQEFAGLSTGTLVAAHTPERHDTVLPDVIERDLTQTLSQGVLVWAREQGLTVNAVYETAWALALRALTGHSDVVFGTTVSGRPAELEGVEDIIGLFLNTVPRRVTVNPTASPAAQVRQVQEQHAALMDYHHVGLGRIQQWVNVGTLFDTLYVMRNTPEDDDAFERLSAQAGLADIDGGDATHYPLTFVVHPGDPYRLILSYQSAHFSSGQARNILDLVERVLDGLIQQASVGAIEPYSAGQTRQYVTAGRGEQQDIPQSSLIELFEATCHNHADRIALVTGQHEWTFNELWQRITRITDALRAHNVQRGDIVALAVPRRNDYVAALFAVLAAGAAYVPLDPQQPTARHQEILDATGTRVIVTHHDFVGVTELTEGRVSVPVDPPHPHHTPQHVHTPYSPHDLAYIMFTSGSTGRPKGVEIEHGGLLNMLHNHRRRIFADTIARHDGGTVRVAHTVSFAFDMSWEELFWLLDGHEIHVLNEDVRRDPHAMTAYVHTSRIDVINVTPSVCSALIAHGLLDEHAYRPSLVLLGGEAVTDDVWTALRDTPHVTGYNLYGPTEYTINTLGYGTTESRTPTVGIPIENTDVYVLDDTAQPVADGIPGELYVTGVGLARGYHKQPALTAERFVADPFGQPGARMYRTGDVVRRRADGCLDFVGRVDDQIKIRGYRVELGEVQAALIQAPQVSQAAVIAHKSASQPTTLIGYVVLANGYAENQNVYDDIRTHMRARVPEYVVPSIIMPIAHIPLTSNTKLDVAALPQPVFSRREGHPPRTENERDLCRIFAEVLGLEHVFMEDDFYALGGHSLLAMRAVSLIRTRFESTISVAALAAAPTPKLLLQRLEAPETDGFEPLLTLNAEGEGTPHVFIHPAGGLGWSFAGLAARLSTHSPAYAVQALSLSTRTNLPDTLNAYVEHVVGQLQNIVKDAVHLVGWSFGAHIAHLVASELEARGITVSSLSMLDALPINTTHDPRDDNSDSDNNGDTNTENELTQEALRFLLSTSGRNTPEWITSPYNEADTLDFLMEGTSVWSTFDRDRLERIVFTYMYCVRLLTGPQPITYRAVHAPTYVFTAWRNTHNDAAHQLTAQLTAWSTYAAGPIEQHIVDVDHHGMTSPAATSHIADVLQSAVIQKGATHEPV